MKISDSWRKKSMDDRKLHFYETPDGYDVIVTGDIDDIADDDWDYEWDEERDTKEDSDKKESE